MTAQLVLLTKFLQESGHCFPSAHPPKDDGRRKNYLAKSSGKVDPCYNAELEGFFTIVIWGSSVFQDY